MGVEIIKFLWHSSESLWANGNMFYYYYWSVDIDEYDVLIISHHLVFFPPNNKSVIKKRSIAFVASWSQISCGEPNLISAFWDISRWHVYN